MNEFGRQVWTLLTTTYAEREARREAEWWRDLLGRYVRDPSGPWTPAERAAIERAAGVTLSS